MVCTSEELGDTHIIAAITGGVLEKLDLPHKIEDYTDMFSAEEAQQLPKHMMHNHTIKLEGANLQKGPIYKLSEKELGILKKYLDKCLQKGWICCLTSLARALIIFILKKDSTLQICIDYCRLNNKTRKNSGLLLLIWELFDRLCTAKVFSKIDLHNIYYQIWIKKGDEWKSVFQTRYSYFKYLVMLFRIVNTPAIFQAFMKTILEGLINIFCIVYIDDILIFSGNHQEHADYVCQVLEYLCEVKLFAKQSKYIFYVDRV